MVEGPPSVLALVLVRPGLARTNYPVMVALIKFGISEGMYFTLHYAALKQRTLSPVVWVILVAPHFIALIANLSRTKTGYGIVFYRPRWVVGYLRFELVVRVSVSARIISFGSGCTSEFGVCDQGGRPWLR